MFYRCFCQTINLELGAAHNFALKTRCQTTRCQITSMVSPDEAAKGIVRYLFYLDHVRGDISALSEELRTQLQRTAGAEFMNRLPRMWMEMGEQMEFERAAEKQAYTSKIERAPKKAEQMLLLWHEHSKGVMSGRAFEALRAVHTESDVDAAVEAFLEELFWMSRAVIMRQ